MQKKINKFNPKKELVLFPLHPKGWSFHKTDYMKSRMLSHKQNYLNDFHKQNSEACIKDYEQQKNVPLTVDDVIKQSHRHGRTTIKKIGE